MCVYVCIGAGAGQPGDGGAAAVSADRAIAQTEGEEGWKKESVVHGVLQTCLTQNLQKVIHQQ